MRVRLVGLREIRAEYLTPDIQRRNPSQMNLAMLLAGGRLKELVRVGKVILSEAVDETGKALVGPETYSEQDRSQTRPVEITPAMIQQGGLPLRADLSPAARSAARIARLKGVLRVVYARQVEQITISNPRGLMGELISHPRLEELGIEIRVLPPGDPRGVPMRGTFLAVQFRKNAEQVKGLEFYNEWMQKLGAHPRQMKSNAGEDCTLYQITRGRLGPDSQMVIQVYPQIERAEIPVEFHDVPLP